MEERPDKPRHNVHPVVFFASVGIIFLLLLFSIVATQAVGSFFDALQQFIVEKLGWLYMVSMTGFLVFIVWLMLSRFGSIRLGPDDAKPEFSRPTWFAMLFSAGMGIGLLFFSVAEPIIHFGPAEAFALKGQSCSGAGVECRIRAARHAMGATFFHWGLHPWAVYSVVGLSLAYFGFRKGLPFSIRSTFYPILGRRIRGGMGDAIDILAVVSTLFGVATSLGLGAMQVNAGLHHVTGLWESTAVQVAIITAITAMATASVLSGLNGGIRRLSELNMGFASLLLLCIFVLGPTAFVTSAFFRTTITYLKLIPSKSIFAPSSNATQHGLSTVFYWAWWIAWAPFVGMFIARVSKGRTIREFIIAVLLAPTLVSFVWFTVFGNTALYQEIFGSGGIASIVSERLPTAIFVLFERYPLSKLTCTIGTLSVILFFVTSSDSASLVVDTIASGGKVDPPVRQRVFWAVLEGVVAIVLLFAGGLSALQTATITTALPFCLVIIAMCVSLFRGLRTDHSAVRHGS